MYVGLNFGQAWGDSDFAHTATGGFITDPILAPAAPANLAVLGSGSLHPNGLIAGGQAGYNWQYGMVVVGVEADIQSWDLADASAKGPRVYLPAPPAPLPASATAAFSQSVRSNYLATLRFRAGVTSGRTLLYVTGGLAVTELDFSQSILFGPFIPDTAGGSATKTKTGWALGAGAEMALAGNWTVRGEYLYVQFDDITAHLSNPNPLAANLTHVVNADLTAQIARVGINYKY